MQPGCHFRRRGGPFPPVLFGSVLGADSRHLGRHRRARRGEDAATLPGQPRRLRQAGARRGDRRRQRFDRNILVGGDEVGFFNKLRRVGRTRYTDELWVETDARRTEMGFWRFFWSTVMLHYVFNYTFYRLTGRSLLKRYRPGSTLWR